MQLSLKVRESEVQSLQALNQQKMVEEFFRQLELREKASEVEKSTSDRAQDKPTTSIPYADPKKGYMTEVSPQLT
jgi:hypothetical protein